MTSTAGESGTHRVQARLRPLFARVMREPLSHFLLIGLALFVVYSWMHRGQSGVEPSHEIALSFDDLRTMDLYFESQWHCLKRGQTAYPRPPCRGATRCANPILACRSVY